MECLWLHLVSSYAPCLSDDFAVLVIRPGLPLEIYFVPELINKL